MRPLHFRYRHAALAAVLGLAIPCAAHDAVRAPLPQPPQLAQVQGVPVVSPEAAGCAVTLRLVDARSGEIVPGVVHIANAAGQTIRPAELLPRATSLTPGSLGEAAFAYMDRWFLLPAARTIALPQDAVTVTAFSGIASALATATLDLAGQSSADLAIPVDTLAASAAQRQVSGNVHLHLQKMTLHGAERYATEIAMGDGLDLVFLSYLERAGADEHYISNTFTADDLKRFGERSGVLFGYGEEYRHNFTGEQGYGHVMFLDLPELIRPASFGYNIMKTGNDDGILRTGIEQARAQQATVLWCHNAYGHEDIPNWVAGLIDGQIIFDGGARGDYETGFYRYLNIGLRVPVSMGTDWFYNDMAMTMVALDGPPATEGWLAALRAGQSYISNGPLLEFEVEGANAGDTVRRETGGSVGVRARAVGRNDFLGLELVANGAVIGSAKTQPADGIFAATLETSVPVEASTWLAVRVTPFSAGYGQQPAGEAGFNEYGKPLFAHTSPIYVEVGGKPVFTPAAAESLIAELHSSMVAIRHAGKYTNDAERDKVLAIYEAARTTLEGKLGR